MSKVSDQVTGIRQAQQQLTAAVSSCDVASLGTAIEQCAIGSAAHHHRSALEHARLLHNTLRALVTATAAYDETQLAALLQTATTLRMTDCPVLLRARQLVVALTSCRQQARQVVESCSVASANTSSGATGSGISAA